MRNTPWGSFEHLIIVMMCGRRWFGRTKTTGASGWALPALCFAGTIHKPKQQ
jgi:hypothetical protein